MKSLVKTALCSGPCSYGVDYFEFIRWSFSLGLISADDSVFEEQLKDWVFECDKEMEEFIPLSRLVADIDVPPSALTMKLKEQYLEYLSEEITRDIIEEGILNDVYDHNSCDYSEIEDYVNNRFSELGIIFEEADVDYVRECCDVEDIIQANINSAMQDEQQYEAYKDQGYSMESTTDVIDDLFERT